MTRPLAIRLGCCTALVALWFAMANFDPRRRRDESPAPNGASPAGLGFREIRGAPSQTASPSLPESGEAANAATLGAMRETRLREWIDDDDPEHRDERIAELEHMLVRGEKTPGGELQPLETLPEDLLDFAFGLPTYQRWMFAHPAEALAWIGQHPTISDARILSLLQDWSDRDHEAFERYLTTLPEGAWKQKILTSATYEALPRDPVNAIERARQLDPGAIRLSLLATAAREWARQDPAAAGRWVATVRDASVQDELVGALAIGYAETAPAFAARWIMTSLPPGKIRDRAATEIAGAWAREDAAAAASWVANFPPGEGRPSAIGTLLNVWTNAHQAEAIAWVRAQPDPKIRDEAQIYLGEN